jgi:branched-subunit amino acid aminotransferase/4-amino-4-deoxychorismate lyase
MTEATGLKGSSGDRVTTQEGVALAWDNGVIVKASDVRIGCNDRGFTLADGVFETIRCEGGRALWLDEHLARLRTGAKVLGIPVPLPDPAIDKGLHELLERAQMPQSAIRLTLTRGVSAMRGLWPPGEPIVPTFLATIAPLRLRQSLSLIVAASTRRNDQSPLSRIKSLNYGDSLVARREADERGADDAIVLNTRDMVASCTVGNLFIKVGQGWVTPPIKDGVLPGLARARLVKALAADERTIPAAELSSISAAIVSNSLGAAVVVEIDSRSLPNPRDPALEECLAAVYR